MSFLKSNNTAGGLAKLFLLRLAHYKGIKWVAEYGAFALNDVSSYLEPLYFTQDTGSYQVKYKKGIYEVGIKAKYPGYSQSFEELEGTPFVLVGLTHNKEYLLFGDANNYFIYDHNQESGSDFSDLSHIKFELRRNMMMKPRFIRDPFVLNTALEVLPYDLYLYGSDNWQDLGDGYYILTSGGYSGNVYQQLFRLGPCNFNERAFITFEMKQNFSSNLFARVYSFATTIDGSNHIARYEVEYSEFEANKWITVNVEVWSETPPFNGVWVYLNHNDAPVLAGETIEIRNIVLKTLP
ncbi:hypothetical protein E9993_14760 [Labilibacter sediminis]|nr:hypothetical protein E9993_14760 [Labilibacter sediminis]